MVLNDWVRGKIPFYTMPTGSRPHSEESTESDNPVAETEQVQAEDRQSGPTQVQQRIKNIRVSADFMKSDLKGPFEEEEDEEEGHEETVHDLSGDEQETGDGASIEKDEETTWEQMMSVATGGKPAVLSVDDSSEVDSEQEDQDENDDDDVESVQSDKPVPKKSRMTTNKQKATNYYTSANVKNRNRDKKANAPKKVGVQKKSMKRK